MNLFRSEEHIRKWPRFDSANEQGIVTLAELVQLFSGNFAKRRLDLDYVSRCGDYWKELLSKLTEIGKTRAFWAPPKS
jgi:hypothetical protein